MNDKFKPDGTASLSSEPVRGTVERVTFHNPDSGFCVLRVKCRGQRDLVTVVGYAANLNGGEFIEAVGVWRSHAQYGRQLVADRLSVAPPTTIEGMKRFLSSGMIKGIGPVYGQRLVDHFGRAVFDVIDHHPDRLLEVEGIGPVRREKIVASWQEQKKIREIMVFLYEHGVGTAKAVRIYKKYGDLAINLIRENPYRLAQDINGIGFRTADALAMRLGVAKDSIVRARAGVNYALLEEMASGNCAYPRAGLIEKATAILEIPPEITEQAVAVEELEGNLICDRIGNEDCLFLPWLYGAERSIADILRRLTAGRPVWPQIDVIQAINWVDGKLGIALADSQRQAVSKAINAKAMVVTGGPGVGKTTIIRAIIKILEAKNVKILLAAPTGRAARRMSETTGREAKTIHRLLEYDPAQHDFRRNQHNPLDCQLLIVDECSMVDVPLMLLILRAIPSDSALLLVGDVNQLPSVGAGQVLSDIIESGAVPVVTMNEIFRQAETSRIIVGAHAINRGLMPDFSAGPGGDFYFVNSDDPADATEKIITMVRERIPRRWRFDPLRDIQILCPANVGGLGVRNLNQALQQAPPEYWAADGVHPTAAGHWLMAQQWLKCTG
ncbi:MAG: AAA family ATPase, partial [Negativicutes bacterium]|nr:AAA family ATPase [Negativicutes bacterium]